MANDNIDNEFSVALNSNEENDTPKCVQKNDAECQYRTGDEECLGSLFETHRARTICICKNVDALEHLKKNRKLKS